MSEIAFLGLGQMGAPMAARLVGAGHGLRVWNRTPARAEPLVARGARFAATPEEAAVGADAAITMLADPEALREVLFGDAGLARGLEDGATLIEMSTVGPTAIREIAGRLPAGVRLIDAPVLGSVPQAETGELKVLAGGAEEDIARWREVLSTMGMVRHVGAVGAGAAMKLVVNSTLGALIAGFAEALRLADGLGLDQTVTLDVLEGSMLAGVVRGKRERVESGAYPPNFKLSLAAKDLGLVVQHGGGDLRVAEAALRLFEEAAAAGLGDLDYSAAIAHLRGRDTGP